ncbi:MAG: 7TM diverse intracellular signaling domain-containing protein [Pseudomonadota bacterium]
MIQPRFVAKDVFVKRERDALLVHASVMGASIFVVIFNLCLGLLLRKLLFVYYSAFVASLLISNLVLSGVGPAFVWTGLTGATSHIRELAIVGVSLFFGLMLYQFLETVRKSLVLRIGILFPALLSPIVGCLWFVLPQWRAHQIIASYSFLTTALVLLSIVILAAKRDHRSRLLLPTLILVTVPTTLMIIIPKNDPTLWQIGVLSIDAILIIDHLFELVILADAFLFSLLFSFAIRLAEAEAVRANQELALVQGKISQRIIDVVDVERRRIAADLHDTAGQGMLAVSARLTQLLQKEKFTSKQESEISRTANYSRGVIGDLRRISHDLHPAVIDHLGWRRAIEDLFEQFTENTGIIASLEIDVAEELLTDFQQLHLYRISQEVLTNIAKHSKAANCSGIFLVENDCLIARFWDDGKVAVQTHRPEATTAIGQMIIDQRVRALDGDVQRDLTTGQKHIGISFPLERERLDG